MSFFRKLFNREEPEDAPITLDLDRRRPQLLRLEKALDALAAEMRADHTTDDPGWRSRINEYSRLAGQAMTERKGTPTREGCSTWSSRYARCSPGRSRRAWSPSGRCRTR